MSAPKQRTLKDVLRNDIKMSMLSTATTLVNRKETDAAKKACDVRIPRISSPIRCNISTDLAFTDLPWSSLNSGPTGKQRTVSPAESANELRNPRNSPANSLGKSKSKRKYTPPTPAESATKQTASAPARSVFQKLNIETTIANLQKTKDKSVLSDSSDSEPPNVWKSFENRPRTASPKKERTAPVPVVPMKPLIDLENTNALGKKTPKKRKLADRLTAFGPKVVSVNVAQVSDVMTKSAQKRPSSPAKESVASDLSNADSDASPAKTKKHKRKKSKPIPKLILSKPPIVRKLETLNKVVPPKLIDLKSVNKLEPVLEEEPVKKRKKAKANAKTAEHNVENKSNVTHKPSMRKSDDVHDIKRGREEKKRKVYVIDSPTSLETGSLVVKHPLSEQKNHGEVSAKKFPVLTDDDLIQKFLGVALSNNQKGRIRQVLREKFHGTDTSVLPDVIHNKIQSILSSSVNLTDTDLRKIRVLFNMLKLAVNVQTPSSASVINSKNVSGEMETRGNSSQVEKEKTKPGKKAKEPKRYVVFVGNLPQGIDKETIMNHFSDVKNFITDIRIPKQGDGKKNAIAYVELMNKSTYEIALSKHHSMLGKKRINVLFTTQKHSKMSKAEAKGKTAKLVAMVKSGQLAGSVALKKKRSQRRAKLRQARKQMEEKG